MTRPARGTLAELRAGEERVNSPGVITPPSSRYQHKIGPILDDSNVVLGANVTPRSGSRRARAETNSPASQILPDSTHYVSIDPPRYGMINKYATYSRQQSHDGATGPAVKPPAPSSPYHKRTSTDSVRASPVFFYADEVQPPKMPPIPRSTYLRRPLESRAFVTSPVSTDTFFRADDLDHVIGSKTARSVAGSRAQTVDSPCPRPQSPLETARDAQAESPDQVEHEDASDEAARARRDRKVLDLEISNSSLLAINRTLEREMRKQMAELRRYRRLESRFRSSDSSDDVTVADEDDSEAVSSPTLSSPANIARFADPQIAPLDMTGQQQLLLEARQLNQSISRCLDKSDTLLSTGRQALQQIWRETGDDVGPKVLSPEELDEDMAEHRQGLLSPSAFPLQNPWDLHVPEVDEPFEDRTTELASDHPMLIPETSRPAETSMPDYNEDNDAGEAVSEAGRCNDDQSAPDIPSKASVEENLPPAQTRDLKSQEPEETTVGTIESVPGSRGSFQNLGNYLSSFGKFAGSIRPP